MVFRGRTNLPLCSLFPMDAMSKAYNYSISIPITYVLMSSIPYFHQFSLSFTARTCHATSTMLNHHHSPRIPNVRKKIHLQSFSQRINTLWNNLNVFKSSVNLYISSLFSYSSLLTSPLSFRSHTSYNMRNLILNYSLHQSIYLYWGSMPLGIKSILKNISPVGTSIVVKIHDFFFYSHSIYTPCLNIYVHLHMAGFWI